MITHGAKEASRPSYAAAREERPIPQAPVDRGLLSARERQVVDARARGLLAKEIAGELAISEATVRVLLLRALRKLRQGGVLSL